MRVFTIWDIIKRRIKYCKSHFVSPSDILLERTILEYKSVLSRSGYSAGRVEKEASNLKKQLSDSNCLLLPRLVISVTNKCTLRCRDCNDLMPYVKERYDMPIEKQLEDIDKVFSYVDGIIKVELIGGEPFLYRDLPIIINKLLSKKINQIEITTNGTLMPSDELIRLLKDKRIFVQISDYGEINSKRSQELYKRLKVEKVNVANLKNTRWFSSGNIKKRFKSRARLKYEYACCDAKEVCRVLYRSKIYVCGRGPVLHELGYLKNKTSFLELSDLSPDKDRGRQEIKRFLLNKYAECCDFCDYASDKLTYVKAGIQVKKEDIMM